MQIVPLNVCKTPKEIWIYFWGFLKGSYWNISGEDDIIYEFHFSIIWKDRSKWGEGWEKIDCQLIIIELVMSLCVSLYYLIFSIMKIKCFFFLRILCVLNMPCSFLILGLFAFLRICWFWWQPGRKKWSKWLLGHQKQPTHCPLWWSLVEWKKIYFFCVISPRKRLLFSLHSKGDVLCYLMLGCLMLSYVSWRLSKW